MANLERSYHDHLDFHESQQESEKWLLQISFKLMSHNSLNVSSMELTQRQMDKHRVILLSLICSESELLKNSCSYDKDQNFEIYLVKSRNFTTFFITSSSMMSLHYLFLYDVNKMDHVLPLKKKPNLKFFNFFFIYSRTARSLQQF